MAKTANLQDLFLSKARRSEVPVTVFLVNGFQIRGSVGGFDTFTVLVLSDGKQNLIYKHAISTIIPLRAVDVSEVLSPGEEQAGKTDPCEAATL